MQRRKISRRQFLSISASVSAGLVAAACGGEEATNTPMPAATEAPAPTEAPKAEATAAPAEPTTPPEPVSEYQEAPMLAALVASGELPPVDERLPLNPWVAPMAEAVGNYGGVMRRAFKGVSDRWGPTKHIDRFLVWFDQDLVLQPRLCESWESNPEGSEWTYHLREGTKWSDGRPLTSASFIWWFENVMLNEELNPTPPRMVTTGDPPVVMEALAPDDYTIVFKYAHPRTLHPFQMTRQNQDVLPPDHYMEQFHADFADPAELDAKLAESGFNSWSELFLDKMYWYTSPDRPMVTGAWRAVNELSSELFLMERNPYFWGVDPDGKQLPYLDQVNHRLFEDAGVFDLWVVGGELDFHYRHTSISNFTLYKESEEAGDYQVLLGIKASHVAMQPNHTVQEPKLREFFNDLNVRKALSLCANRQEMNELVYDGLLVPRQYSPLPMSPNYYAKAANAYIEYDPDEANRLLDEAGYTEKDGDGFRLWKDGSGTISWVIEFTALTDSATGDAVQLYINYLNDVGLNASYTSIERSLYTEHFQANDIEAAWWGGDRTVVPLAPEAIIFRGTQDDRPWCPAWGHWYEYGDADPTSEEPPEGHWIWDIWDIWDQITMEPDPDQQNKLFEGILDIWAEQLPMIGFLGEEPGLIVVKNGFKNYIAGQPLDDTTADEHFLNTETYFWDNPEEHM
jgi:peptide/nickel transport system substrate-binding protein